MSRLKEVNSDWILRRLESWGQRVSLLVLQQHGLEHILFPLSSSSHSSPLPCRTQLLPYGLVLLLCPCNQTLVTATARAGMTETVAPAQERMPFIGPKKGALLRELIREHKPRQAVEVGSMCGYSALVMAQAMGPGARLISIEADWKWALAAKRFVWQATQGDKSSKPVRVLCMMRCCDSVMSPIQTHCHRCSAVVHHCSLQRERSMCKAEAGHGQTFACVHTCLSMQYSLFTGDSPLDSLMKLQLFAAGRPALCPCGSLDWQCREEDS